MAAGNTAISIDSGKIVDTEITSRNCKACTLMEPVKNSDPLRHEISAPNMGKTGAVNIYLLINIIYDIPLFMRMVIVKVILL